jgi:mRNA interferase MazF
MAKTAHHSQRQKVTGVHRADIFLVAFDPTIGHEIQKTRPALVIQNDVGNRHSPLTIVAAITSKISSIPYPVEVPIEPSKTNVLEFRCAIRLDHIRTVDRRRLVRRLGVADSATMSKVDEAIKISLGLVRV